MDYSTLKPVISESAGQIIPYKQMSVYLLIIMIYRLCPPACRLISSAMTIKTITLGILETIANQEPERVPAFLTVKLPRLTTISCTCGQDRNSLLKPMPCWLMLKGSNV